MKTYEGKRTIDGLVVTVDGKRLDEHYEVKRLTRYGFEWTYEGESPQQLALAILYDYLGDKQRAIALSQPFMKEIVANFDNDWTLTGAQIDDVSAHRRGSIAALPSRSALSADMRLIIPMKQRSKATGTKGRTNNGTFSSQVCCIGSRHRRRQGVFAPAIAQNKPATDRHSRAALRHRSGARPQRHPRHAVGGRALTTRKAASAAARSSW